MNVLELCAGSRSIGKAAEQEGCKVFSSDLLDFPNIDYVVDILEFDVTRVPFVPDMIWVSPPCTGFSIAAISHHWDKGGVGHWKPKSDTARLGLQIVNKMFDIIDHFKALNPALLYFVENPVGGLRKHPIMNTRNIIRRTVRYCQYGDTRAKPTDIWTNCETWKPRPMCKNGDTCHEAAPRGSKTGTQGLKGAYLRSIIPEQLCREVIQAAIKYHRGESA